MKKTLIWLVGISIILTIAVSLILEIFILRNNFPSRVSNDAWAGFLGGFIGAMVGAVCTCWAVLKEIDYQEKTRKNDEVAAIRPYLTAVSSSKDKNKIEIQNIGLHSACNIYIE